MTNLITISLSNLRFMAYHGLYAAERETGNEFDVTLTVSYHPLSGVITDIADTINYVSLYDLLKTEMQKPRELLETFAMEMTDIIHHSFQQVRAVDISITKLTAPIVRFEGKVGVRYVKEY